MTLASPTGWGGGPWGLTSWGGGPVDDLQLVAAVAVRENAVRLQFNTPPQFTGVLEPHDASNHKRYAVVGVSGTFGLDDQPVRPVMPLYALVALVELGLGNFIDLYVDRPFSPYPAQYRVSVNNLLGQEGFSLDLNHTSTVFYGLQRAFVPNTTDHATPSRDIASPQTISAAQAALPQFTDLVLGTYQVDDTGDYAFDEGPNNLKKRVFRRLFTRPGGFAYMPSYGIGVGQYIKKLNQAGTRQRLIDECERQLAQEPDVLKVKVKIIQRAPSLFALVVLIKTVQGSGVKFEANFNIAA